MFPSFNSKITTAVLGVLCAWLFLLAAGAWVRHGTIQRDLDGLERQIAKDQRENAQLSQELVRMQQPVWLALLARDRLNYKRPDESVVFVYTSDVSGTIGQSSVSQDERPDWRKWLDWLGGK